MRIMFLFAVLLTLAFPAMAQDGSAIFDEDQRLELAQKMHDIKPARLQLEAAIDGVARQRVPEDKRAAFKKVMLDMMDVEKLEGLSIKAMAEIFTVAELERMIDYFGSAEAQSIADKLPVYQAIITPELTKMVDAALLELRTGSGADKAE